MAKPTYIENFGSNEDIIREYSASEFALDGAKIYLAWYGYGSYCGSSLVIFEKDGKLYEVNGSHCSCNGLEGQWQPEETSWGALAMRSCDSYCDSGKEAQEALEELIKEYGTV